MLRYKITEEIDGSKIKRVVEADGHVDTKGEENIICSAASMTLQTLAIFLAKRYPYSMDASFESGRSFIECTAMTDNITVATAFTMTIEGLRSLAKRYPNDVQEV